MYHKAINFSGVHLKINMTNTRDNDLIKDITFQRSRGYELLTSGNPEDRKRQRSLPSIVKKPEKQGTILKKLTQLREKYMRLLEKFYYQSEF